MEKTYPSVVLILLHASSISFFSVKCGRIQRLILEELFAGELTNLQTSLGLLTLPPDLDASGPAETGGWVRE